MDKKKKKNGQPKKDNGNGRDTEKEISEQPPYSDIRPRKLKEPLDQPEGPENEAPI